MPGCVFMPEIPFSEVRLILPNTNNIFCEFPVRENVFSLGHLIIFSLAKVSPIRITCSVPFRVCYSYNNKRDKKTAVQKQFSLRAQQEKINELFICQSNFYIVIVSSNKI